MYADCTFFLCPFYRVPILRIQSTFQSCSQTIHLILHFLLLLLRVHQQFPGPPQKWVSNVLHWFQHTGSFFVHNGRLFTDQSQIVVATKGHDVFVFVHQLLQHRRGKRGDRIKHFTHPLFWQHWTLHVIHVTVHGFQLGNLIVRKDITVVHIDALCHL